MIKKIAFFTTCAIFLLIINNLIHETVDLWQKQSLVQKTQQELTRKQEENKKLKQELANAQSSSFVEEQARDKLLYVKSGEEAVILPQTISQKKYSPQMPQEPNWQQWIMLFFN